MTDRDPSRTQRDVAPAVAAELAVAGFEDAHEIGRGGFGVVYRCAQPALDRTVAIKVLTGDLDDDSRARFLREQQAMGRMTGHPQIVGVLHVGTTDSGRPYIVMPYHPQDSLDARIQRDGPLDVAGVLRLGIKMAGALEAAHRLGIVHRDVKPANILLTDYGEPALTDFGIAHIAGGFRTSAGTVTGSPAFTAPEVLKGEPPSPASDVYGLGATLFSALTGHAAFERHSGEQVIAQFLRITTQPVADLREQGIPGDVSAAIEWAMSTDPGDRPASAADFGSELRRLQASHGLAIDEMALPTVPGVHPHDQDSPDAAPPPPGAAAGARSGPLPALPTSAGKLPLELTGFVGRRRELAEIRERLSSSRLVTLTGIGGVGKTRLALRAAAELRRGFGDGVCLVELGGLRDDSVLVDVVAAALGLRNRLVPSATAAAALLEQLVTFLAGRHLLLVLDNCEHVIDAAAELVDTLLRTCAELRVLATSREPLGIGGEAVLHVPPLPVPDPQSQPSLQGMPSYDAVTLFAQRAAAAVPGFEITDDNRETVTQICRQLDGLPLPIELAAARLRVMSAEQIRERITDRYQLLTAGPRGVPSRQQTLRLSVDWSYELCDAREQRLWAHLSIFAGTFDLAAAENVCAGELTPDELLDAIASLVGKSILIREQADAAVRFRMLETLRDYGREKAVRAGQYAALREQHLSWYRTLAMDADSEWIGPDQVGWIARLDREQPNLREAMTFCLTAADDGDTRAGLQIAAALYPFWLARGQLSEGRHWLGRALARHPHTAERVKALYAASLLAAVQGDIPAATALVTEGRALVAESADPVDQARIGHIDGFMALVAGDAAKACRRLQDALAALEARGDDSPVRIGTLQSLGWAYELQGDTARSTTCFEQVLEITESRGESVNRSYALWSMGFAVWRQGDSGEAVRLLERGLRLTRRVDDPFIAATYLDTLAWIASGAHDDERAAILLGAAEALRRATGSTTVLFPHLLVHHEECERRIRDALGERAFTAAHRKGRALTFGDAVAYALRERSEAATPSAGTAPKLTKRERQVADLVAQGLTNKAIATRLMIAQRTAEGHVEHILTKLGFTARAQIAAWVVEHTR
ncbi:MAG: protein kinase [Nocardiaceae bacterium]|nr:protein kinase [Nocardiaceae bacterium]